MEDKELLSAWEKIQELYGPQKRTYDEFKFQMQSNEYRKKTFTNLGRNAEGVFGYDNYDRFNADKFLPAPALEINDTPTTADNLPRFSASSNSFVDNSTEVSRNSMSNPKTMGGPGGSSRRISPATQAIIDANKEKKEVAKKQVKLERAKTAAATTSDLVTKNADFYDVVSNYSSVSGEDLLSSQLSYNNGELSGIEKGQFEQKAINFISEDMFAVVDDTENSQVWKDHGDEYGFLINQLNAQGKEIKILQDQLTVEQDPAKKQTIIDGINEIMSEGADYSKDTPTSTGVDNKQFRYNSYEDMQERFGKLNSLPEFKNYQRAINVLGHIRDVSEDFESRNPEFVENQKNLKSAQQYVDIKEKYNIPTVGANIPKWAENGISKPILSSLAKAAVDIATLPRTLSFNDDYGWTDSLAESAERLLSKEFSPNMVAGLGQSSDKDRGLSERVAMVDDYQLVVSDNIGADYREAKNVRDKDGFLIQDPKIVQEVIEKYEADPEKYKSEQQYNYETILPKFTGVMADLGILMFGTKGLGTAVKGTGALAKGAGMGKVGNYLSKSAVANRIGLTGAVTGQTHNGLYGEAIRQGMSPSEASSFALAGSLAVAAVAQINPQFYLIGEKRAATKLTERYIAYLAQGGKESKKTAFKYAMKEVFGAGKREMFEELAEIPALNAVRGGFNEFLTPDKQFEVEWSRGEIEESAIFGLAAGTATGPMNITNQSALQQQATYASYKAKDKFFSRMNDLVGKEYMDADTGKMLYYTQEQADAKKAEFTNLFKQLDAAKLSTNKLSEESETRLLSLFQSGNNIKRLMDNAEGNPALMAVLEAQYSLTNDAIGQELESNKKQPKVDPKSDVKPKKPPTDGTGSAPVATEAEVSIDNDIDSELNNDPDNVLDGRKKPDPKVTEKTTEPEVEVSSQENTEKKERYKDSQIPASQQNITYEDRNGETNIARVTTQLDGSRKIELLNEEGNVFFREKVSKNNTLTNEEYVTRSTEGDIKTTEDLDIKTVINPKLESRMSDRQRKAAGIDVAPNPNTKVEGDQNIESDNNTEAKSDPVTKTKSGTVVSPGKVKIETKEEFSNLENSINEAKTDEDYDNLGFKRRSFYDKGNATQRTHENVEVDLTGSPVYTELHTKGKNKGKPNPKKKFHKVFNYNNNTSYYVPVGTKLYMDKMGITRPSATEGNIMGGGTYMTDTMLVPDITTENKTEPQKPLFTKDEVTTAKATGDYLTPLVERLKENFPGVEIVVDAKAVEDLALKMGVSPEGAKGARGVFDATNNRVIINPETANKDTPIHEFAHVWTTLAKEERKELWDKGMSLIGDSDIVKKLREQIAQNPDLQKVYTEDKILDEALAIAIGQRGAKIFESQEAQGIWDNWVKEFFDFIKDKFNVKSEGDIQNLTLREFIELASTEILTGEKVVPVNSRIKLKKLIGNIEIKENPGGQLIMINTKTGKEVSKPTRRKIEKQILEMNELPADYIAAGLKLKEIIEDDAYDRGQFYDQVEASFVGYSVSKESFIEFSDANNINNSLARSWFKKGALPLDAIAQELTEIVFGNDYNANSEQITPQDLVDIMLRNPGNFLKVPDAVHDAKLEFLETTGISPTLKNAQTIASKQTDQLAKLDPVYDDYTDVPFQLSFQANFKDPKTGIEFTYDKNTEKFKALQDAGFITKDKSLSDFADKNIILHTPDFAFSGQISSDGEVLVEGKGGMYYPIKFHQDGYFWASTKDGAASLVTALNKSLKANGGKIYMGLVTATPTKLLSSVTAANGVVDIFMSDAFSNKLGITKGQLKRSLVNAANDSETITKNGKTTVNGLRADVRSRANADETLKLIRNKLAADKSSFDDRKFFVQSFLDRIAKNINKSANSKTTQKKLLNFFKSSVGFKDMKSTGTKLSKANLSDAVSYMLGEPLLRGEANTNKIYAVLEIDGQVEETTSDAHESYPKAIKSKDGNKTKLHILKDRADWRDSVADPDTNTNIKVGEPRKKDGKPRSFVQILPTTAGMTYNPVRVLNTSENPGMSFQIEGDPKSDEIVSEADVVNESDLALFSLPTTNEITQKQVDEALNTDKTSQRILAKGINPKTGDNVGVRLNLNVFKNTKVPVQTVHKGSNTDNYKKVNGVVGNFRGEALTYKAAVTIKDAHFNTHQKSVYEVKNKIKNKFPLASVDGKYQEVPLDKQNYSGVEIGFNPMKNSLFVDANGKPVKRADEVTIIGTKVYARGNVEYFTEENKPKEFSPSFQIDGDTNKKQVSESIQRLKEQGKFSESQLVDYFGRRFPDISKKELGEMYNGKVPEDSPRSEKRKYTSRLEQVLSEETFEQISEEAKTYIPKRNNITEAEAQFMFENIGLEESIVIVKSNPDWLLPEVRIALTNKVVKALEVEARKLREAGKVAEANVISASINGIVEIISAEGTKAGRFIQAFKLLDALSADRTVSLINKKLKEAGKDPLTKEQEAELRRLKEESDNAAEGLPKSTAMANQYKFTAQLIGTNFKSLFEAYFYASILSGTTTQIRNIMANVMSIGNELMVTSIREAFMGNPKAIFHATEGLIKGLSKGWLNAKHILETGVKSDQSDKFDSPVLLEWWRYSTNNKVLDRILNSKLSPWSPNFLKYVQRAMVAGDQMFFHSAKEMQARALASRIKKGKNLTAEDIKRAESILKPSEEVRSNAIAQAKEEGFKEGSTQFKVRVHELMEAERDMTIQGASEDFAAKTTFNYEPEGALSYLYNFIVQSRQMQGVGPIITTFIPFARVLTNVFNRFLHYTFVGAITAAKGKVRLASDKTRILSKEEKADLYIKATIGMSTLAGLVAYIMSQADDDDAVLKISAAGPKDFNKKYELQKAGWKPFTVSVGDASFSYADHPLYFILAAAGTLYESDKYGNSIDSESNADLFSYVALTTSMSMLQQSWLQGLTDLGGILNSNDPAKAVLNKTFGVASSIAMPNFHKQLVRSSMEILGDPIKARRTGTLSGAVDKLYRDIPLANSGLYDMVDNYGDPVIPEQGQKFVPLDIRFGDQGDPLVKHLVEEGVFVGSASNRKIEDYELGDSRYLNPDEYQVYKMESAKAVGKSLRENSRYLKGLKGEYLGEAVKALKSEARTNALYDLFYYDGYKKIKK